MCVVSAVGDYWRDNNLPNYPPWVYPTPPATTTLGTPPTKQEVEELKKLLLAAKKYDESTGQPNCETDEKVAIIKRVAELLGIDMEEVFGK
jgi:hypothetical protein